MNSSFSIVNCPNCGGHAARHYLAESALVRTQCPHCDYLMITSSDTGNVVEAYAPGLVASRQ
ncbi:MAG: replication restart DNA helicase PriA [Cyanobacteria bacterium P01_F01_bin.86]